MKIVSNTLSRALGIAFLGGLLFGSGAALAQQNPLIDYVTPAIPGVTAGGLAIQKLSEGHEGSEGPLGLPDGSFLFTETRAQRIVRVAEDGTLSTFLERSNGANGLALTPEGTLIAVQVVEPRVGVVHPPEKQTVLARDFEGKAFTRPNDVVRATNGDLYFTDSAQNATAESAGPAVYRLAADGRLERITTSLARPNGIVLSPDERTLYVADTLGEHVVAIALDAHGKASAPRPFAALQGWDANKGTSGADGLAVDADGRLYVASTAGIEVFAADGKALGVIQLPVKPQNLAFAGSDKRWLYVVGQGTVLRFRTLSQGLNSRAK